MTIGGSATSDETSAGSPALVVVHGAMSTTGPVRERNEDHLGWGRIGSPQSSVVVGSLTDVVAERLMSDVEGAVDAWGPLGSAGDAADASGFVFVVADGLGGYGGGDVASRLAIGELLDRVTATSDGAFRGATLLRAGFNAANQRVFDAALSGQGTRRMQTTLTALVLVAGEAHIGHVGDSRIYRSRGDMLDLLTIDHTQVMEMLRMRLLNADQAADHPARHALTRSVGAEITVRTDVRVESLVDGDRFLLCSDGLWSKVDSSEIQEALRADVAAGCERLVRLAIDRGGEDNATAVTVRVERAGTAADRPRGWRRFLPS
jgi:PPM family protein phosphatase